MLQEEDSPMPLRISLCVLLLASIALTINCTVTDNANTTNTNANAAAANTPPASGSASTGASGASYNTGSSANTASSGSSSSGEVATYDPQNHNYQGSPTPTPSRATPTPTPRGDSLDDQLASLPLGEAAFNAPEKMRLNESVNIEVKIGGPKMVGQMADLITGEGKVESHRVKVARVMEAQLAGANFEIIPITHAEQPVSESEPTEWEWQVKAKQEGTQLLHLTLNAVITVDGKERRRKTQTYKKEISVEVAARSRIAEFFSNNISWIVPVLIIPFVGGLGLRLRRVLRRRDNPPPPAS
jgi:hypothetical protein